METTIPSKVVFTILIVMISLLSFTCKEAPTEPPIVPAKITGRITDAKTNAPIEGVQIVTNPATVSIVTNSTGDFTIEGLNPGQYTVIAKKAGYNEKSVSVIASNGKITTADMLLSELSPELGVSTALLDFDAAQTNLTFTIVNKSGYGTLEWQIAFDKSWISVSPASGDTKTETDVISVSVNRDSLSYGNFAGTISISSSQGTFKIDVVVTKSNPNAPQLTVTPLKLQFGTSADSKTVIVKNTGTGVLPWDATPTDNWIGLSRSSGNTTAGSPESFNVSINKAGLSPGNYEALINITANGQNQSVVVSITVQAGILPAPSLQLLDFTTSSSIGLGWTKSTGSTFSNYKVFRSLSEGVSEASTLVATINNSETNYYTDMNLASGTKYFYKVYAYNSEGIGSGSNEVSAVTKRQIGSWVVTETLEAPYENYAYSNCFQTISETEAWYVSMYNVYHFNNNSWNSVHTSTIGRLTCVWMGTDGRGYVGTDNGILKYDGIGWTKVTTFPGNFVYDIVGSAMNKLWVTGGTGIYYFNGTTWQFFNLTTVIIDLDYVSDSEIWALSNEGKVFKYNGTGWNYIGTPYAINANQIDAVSSTDVWIAYVSGNPNGLWHYDGVDFSKNYKLGSGSSGYNGTVCMDMFSSDYGWRYNDIGMLTIFDGNSWTSVTAPNTQRIVSIKLPSAKSGWAVGSAGTIFRYTE
ncbi:hypothetical protein MASR1M107_21290 [Ignavibacteriales bacterium]